MGDIGNLSFDSRQVQRGCGFPGAAEYVQQKSSLRRSSLVLDCAIAFRPVRGHDSEDYLDGCRTRAGSVVSYRNADVVEASAETLDGTKSDCFPTVAEAERGGPLRKFRSWAHVV